ncbi:MAG: FhaA domain-containing protein [Nesterenkonia sp.]
MGLLDSLEHGIERAVRSAFSGRGGGLGPVEIATAVRRHMDRESTEAGSTTSMVPNLYKIRLAEYDFVEAKKYGQALAEELCEEIIRHADSQGYTVAGPVKATFVKNTELKRGQMSIESQTEREVAPAASGPRPTHAPASGSARTTAMPTSPQRPPQPASRTGASLEYEGRTTRLTEESTIVGRSSSAEFVVSDTGVSRQHLEIQRVGSRWFAHDLGSTNGSYVDGAELRSAETEIHDGAVITLGSARLRFRLG